MSGRVTSACLALLFTLTSVSAVQKLNSINDLKKLDFGQSVPKHSLLLLHWFANVVDIDNNNVIYLTFDPRNGDYGSHHYGNYEQLLDPVPQRNIRYYTVGNLNENSNISLPDYVLHSRRGYDGRNRDRIIFRVIEQTAGQQRVDRVYLTQHYETHENRGTMYDRDHTYQITAHLLNEIIQFSVEGDQESLSELRDRFGSNANDHQLRDITNIWGHLACIGLFLFIVIQEKHAPNQRNNRPQRSMKRNEHAIINMPEDGQNARAVGMFPLLVAHRQNIQLEVKTGRNGKARIVWSNIPEHRLKNGVMAVLFESDKDDEARTHELIRNRESGSYDTSVPLNEGLQVRLHKVKTQCCFWKTMGEEICRGPEFQNPKAVNIAGYDAKLQLFAKDGKASARLFVKKTFREWMSEFNKSWVGFYTSPDKDTDQYEWWQWQWATKFRPNYDIEDRSYYVYEYQSGMAIAPGVQVRFITKNKEVKVHTPNWE
uniref:Uncharacterized protein n=1 Tax=Echeneis naucrates TaxID=173247 RepID=A0A665VC40_ECHNA